MEETREKSGIALAWLVATLCMKHPANGYETPKREDICEESRHINDPKVNPTFQIKTPTPTPTPTPRSYEVGHWSSIHICYKPTQHPNSLGSSALPSLGRPNFQASSDPPSVEPAEKEIGRASCRERV